MRSLAQTPLARSCARRLDLAEIEPMKLEYLLFNAVIGGSVLISALFCPKPYKCYLWHALGSILFCATPYIAWDALVTDRHWNFNPKYVLDLRLAHLPLGEWLFFFTVPFATIFTWEMFFASGRLVEKSQGSFPTLFFSSGICSSAFFLWQGKEYTGLAIAAFSLAMAGDHLMSTGVFRDRRAHMLAAFIFVWTGLFNGYLTARPVVRYDPQYQLDIRLGTIPIEDFVYGLSLLAWVMVLYRYACRRWPQPEDPRARVALQDLRARTLPAFLLKRCLDAAPQRGQ